MNKIQTLGFAIITTALVGAAHAVTVAFDIQGGTNTASGFIATNSFPATDGTYSIDVDVSPSGTRDRGAVADPDSDILRDLAFWSTSNPITFTITGLTEDTEYTVRGWSFDSNSGNDGKIINFTTNGGTYTHTTDSFDPSSGVFSMPNLTSDGLGSATIVMDHTGGVGGSVSLVNGFELTVVPEPSSAALLGLIGGLALLRRRR